MKDQDKTKKIYEHRQLHHFENDEDVLGLGNETPLKEFKAKLQFESINKAT